MAWLERLSSDLRHLLATAGIATPLHDVLVHIVPNGVRGDSRVIKSALASAGSGHTTVIVGITAQSSAELFAIDGVPVLLVPLDTAAPKPDLDNSGDAHLKRVWTRHSRPISAYRTATNAARSVRGQRAGNWGSPRQADARWIAARPTALRTVLALHAALDVLQPRFVHVHDAIPLPAAIAYRAHQGARRRRVRVLYDAHECMPELARSYPESPAHQALETIEREYCADADAVVTVSPQIARILEREYRLRRRPRVVINGPSSVRDPEAPSLRETIGLAPDVPLAVYSGWVAVERGLGTTIRALPLAPDIHLALVVNRQTAALRVALQLARRLGVGDRIHLAPYVPPQQVTQYLSSATVGLIPLMPGDHFAHSLPTKFREYAHAGLPIIVSNHATMAREIRKTGIGLVFKAGNVGGLALQLRAICDDPGRYSSKLTPELLDSYAWESQLPVLGRLYGEPAGENRTDEIAGLAASAAEPHAVSVAATTPDSALLGTWLGIGRANSASQAYLWSEAVQTHLGVSATSFGTEHDINAGPHVDAPKHRNVRQGARELGRVLDSYTHLLVDGFEPLFGPTFLDDLERELDVLALHMRGLGLIAHGSDTRDPDRHMAEVHDSYFTSAPPEWTEVLRKKSQRNREIAVRSGLPTFVSTPDLLKDLPHATWLPLTVDVDNWAALPPATFPRRLRVLHRPSRSEPPIKGTDVIDPVLETLAAEGLIEYVSPSGIVPRHEMGALVAQADIVVDQIRTGSYGVAAVEAMAAGRVVVGAVTPDARAHTLREIPVVDAPAREFEDSMRALIAEERSQLQARAQHGRDYARDVHDGTMSAHVIESQFLRAKP